MNNRTIFQLFHWYVPTDGTWWKHCATLGPALSALGITDVYLPPAYKSAYGGTEPGYAVYDLFDLGEFDQKGSLRTKYGTKEEYISCIQQLQANQIHIIADIVFNHKHGGDEKEKVIAQQVNNSNRMEALGERQEIEAFTKFFFPGRNKKYSAFEWDHNCFTGIDGEDENGKLIYILPNEYGDTWEELIEEELGNFDYLMGADIDFRNPYVRDELKRWGEWYVKTTGVDSFRLDAVKHITPSFIVEWVEHMRATFKKDFFCVGEYWREDVNVLVRYLDTVNYKMQLFDVPLHYNFYSASKAGNQYDMRTIFDNTLVQQKPEFSVTFVDNHDTQPLQALDSYVDYWFQPLAYALILLREQGIPSIFYPALYGVEYMDKKGSEEHSINLEIVPALDCMLAVRKDLAYGMQRDYFDHANTVGWTREGVDEKEKSGCAVLITNGSAGDKIMEIGKKHAGKTFVDVCGNRPEQVVIDENGNGKFFVNDGSVSVWVQVEAVSRSERKEAKKATTSL